MINVHCIFFNLKVEYKEVVVTSAHIRPGVCYKLYRSNNYKLHHSLSTGVISNEAAVCASLT